MPTWKLVTVVAAVWYIIVAGLLLRPGREPICIVCGNAGIDLGIKVITLVVAVAALAVALRAPAGKLAGS